MSPKAPKKLRSKAKEALWLEIWKRHVLFDEAPADIRRHFHKQNPSLTLAEVREAILWGSENSQSILEGRVALRAKAAGAIAARRKLIWAEIQRLSNVARTQGGTIETVRRYDAHGELQGTVTRTRDISSQLMAAEHRLAEVDKFAAAIDSLTQPLTSSEGVSKIEMDLAGFMSAAYVDPADAPEIESPVMQPPLDEGDAQ